MALSFVAAAAHQHQPSFFDLQSLFDPYSLHNSNAVNFANQHQHQYLKSSKILLTDSMEYSTNHNSHQQHNCNSSETNHNHLLQHTNRNLLNGYHHQHFGAEYEPVITFVDSPPNSEESWPDEQSKESPVAQIIDVQTIYSESGSRKRRMDWDPLDLGQSESNASLQTGDLAGKLTSNATHHQLNEKEKGYKKEKLSNGRANWADDIGFDLNAEFSSNSYLNNESFMTFSSGLPAVLKQEPQTEQSKINKSSLNIVTAVNSTTVNTQKHNNDKQIESSTSSSSGATLTAPEKQHRANDLIDSQCACGSPQGSNGNGNQQQTQQHHQQQQQIGGDQNTQQNNKSTSNVNDQARNTVLSHQLLTVVDASKIEQAPIVAQVTPVAANSDDYKFQYILAAATSIATKNNEDTLTYLNQGQSYEIKLKKIGDLSLYRDKVLKSVIKICFHERRLQYMEREQMQQWQASRPGERIIEVDLPLSYGLCHVSQPLNPNCLNTVEIFWDPMKEVGVYVKVNCISTEFTPKKHGGEKGVPFRLQIETYIENNCNNNSNNNNNIIASSGPKSPQAPVSPLPLGGVIGSPHSSQSGNLTPNSLTNIGPKQPIHAAACQIKVFKLKGADRKHKQDREKIQKRPQTEQDKFQPSYECTIMTDVPLDLITTPPTTSAGCFSPEYMKIWPNSPVHIPKYDGMLSYASASPNANASPIAINSVSSTNTTNLKVMDSNMIPAPLPMAADTDEYISVIIMPESTPAQVTQWLTHHRLTSYLATFAHFSGSDIMRMSKEDLIQICGLADGIRMFNILRSKAITPRLTIYVSLDGSNFNAIYLICNTAKELLHKVFKLPGFYEHMAKGGSSSSSSVMNGSGMDNSSPYHSWGGMHSKYSGSSSNIFNDVNSKSLVYVTGPAGIHVAVTDEVLNNEIKDGSLYGLEVQSGKIIMKLMNKNEN